MNPMHWPRRHQLALVIVALVGAVVGAVVGYFVHAAAQGASGGARFALWLTAGRASLRRLVLAWESSVTKVWQPAV